MTPSNFADIVDFIRSQYPTQEFIPLHEPRFSGNEKAYVLDAIESTFVSSVGEYVNRFERDTAQICQTGFAIATVNGTAALHTALLLTGVGTSDEVITTAFTFVATANAIAYTGANPVFLDIDEDTLGLSPVALENWLKAHALRNGNTLINKNTGRTIKAAVVMHAFGLPARIEELVDVCNEWGITLIEDAAEALGSTYKGKPLGSFGAIGTLSFNGNKTITCGGGGAVLTRDEELAKKAKHLTTQAKVAHPWEFFHDQLGYNYRMPNLNAALACAQLEQLVGFVDAKRSLAERYKAFFSQLGLYFYTELPNGKSNYWLNAIRFESSNEANQFLSYSNSKGVMTRPVWRLMTDLPMFASATNDGLTVSRNLAHTIVNIPSSVPK
ncbi:MAG TPA: LegC family aminotransferase [Luteibaculaceae bacterium]|nr:LegC family aminotransferase [Luteibaculaceae bacterium]